jgi:pimeloyl-ACP methyl ester carboxylesterase
MATYVLVGGAWLGGWCWQGVARRLREQGQDAYPVTLTGLGERSHLAGPDVNLETQITDVVNLLLFEDLREVVLVGHSYAGIILPGAADRATERIAQLVYVDTGPVPDGLSYLDFMPPPVREQAERQVAEQGEGWRLPVPSWEELETVNGASLEGLDGRARRRFRARATPQPFATYTQPLRLSAPATAHPKLLISCTYPLEAVRELVAGGHPWFTALAGPEWRFLVLPTGHWPMFSRSDDLAVMLGEVGTAVAAG